MVEADKKMKVVGKIDASPNRKPRPRDIINGSCLS
jgi:hypothetical protein